MNELVQIHETTSGRQIVIARDLWRVLESKRQFADWIKYRTEEFRFKEGVDWWKHEAPEPIENYEIGVVHNLVKNPGRPAIEYYLTLDCGKHFALIENTDVGDKVRQYFIDCEKELVAAKVEIRNLEIKNLQLQLKHLEYEKRVFNNFIDLREYLNEQQLDVPSRKEMQLLGQKAKKYANSQSIDPLLTSTGDVFKGANRFPREFWKVFLELFELPITEPESIPTLEEFFN
jgi:anti-repressor protein